MSTSYVPNGLNEYGSIDSQTSTYDLNGNLQTWYPPGGEQAYAYDSENRLVSVSFEGSTLPILFYDYDGLGRRISKTFNGVATNYLLDGDEEIAEYSGSTVLHRYITGPAVDERIAHLVIATATKTYYHTNHQGSVMAMTDNAGNVTQSMSYDEYGNGTPTTGEQFGYTGRRFDPETGLYYYRARYYAPQLGRFLQTDPVGYKDDIDLYTYTGNDPLDKTDPSGTCDSIGTCNFERDAAAVLAGKMSPEQFRENISARAAPAVAEAAALAGTEVAAIVAVGKAIANSDTAVSAARGAASAAREEGATGGATTGLVTRNGDVFTGASTRAGGPGSATNATVQSAVDAVPAASRNGFTGCCGEVNAASNAANAGANLQGSVMATVRAVGRQAGQVMEACDACKFIANKLGITLVSPP